MSIAPDLDLTAFSRYRLMEGPTPIQHLGRLSKLAGNVDIYVKRDDLMGLGGGGSKLRKLEFLLGEALAQGADTIVTVGARQSNHARLTAAAAARAGLACEIVLTRTVPRDDNDYLHNGNVLLDQLLGARIHDLPGHADAMAFAQHRAEDLRKSGRKVYLAPLGGSSAVGNLGYAACAAELLGQAREAGVSFDRIALPNGSGGTHAGLVAGLLSMGEDPARVVAYNVLATHESTLANTRLKAQQTLELIQPAAILPISGVIVADGQRGDGYGIPTDAMREAVRLLASTEGLLLDPVYGGKAFAGLLQDIRSQAFAPGSKVLFLMTGGLPGLYAYRSAF
ncbi:D-cysteine desulfhydrase family protein [Paraburkholderia phymatum]|uniref:1-aminocyclopropane-1-carboxylate deaminase n=1 Tax=Paraburkholderia phymatum (strain DSM 17167 / CIP 108236 / LMG 21445 / STM815) TaxID=391038 RepID=B2JUX9_PARP8|nr:D-cysteine desulfhydrase family protein [Paraburkholderia phymatum]ACC74757.1 1-aminocyclopropane-1-carboxylate deaminase [Paraburkholderia phymatum STM815]